MKKTKLLYFISEDDYFLTHKLDQAKSAIKNKFEVLIVCKFFKNEKKIKALGFKTTNLNLDRKSINPFKELFCLIEFGKIVFTFKPDLIQCIALKPILYTSLISPLIRKTQIIMCIVGLGYLFIDKKKSTKIIKKIYVMLLNIFLSKKNSHFIFQNNQDKKIIENYLKIQSSKITIIRGSGVDTNKFIKKKTKKNFDLIFHSRILYDKGFIELIEAIKNLRKKRPITLLVLGSPDPNNRSSVELDKIKAWHKQGLINWKRKTQNVIPLIQKSKIAVLPSYREGLPKALLEAASCELPIITSNTVGCKEICINKYNGLLVPVGDYISLANAIEKILDNKKLARFYGKNGRKLVIKKFSDKIVNKHFLNVYKQYI